MHTITEIKPLTNFMLSCRFENGISKQVDLKPFLQKEAFKPLQQETNFAQVANRKYYVEWVGFDVDLSADTLWHIGV